jgi:hypothetical protein
MILHIHSDASYLSEPKARSRHGGYFFLSTKAPTDDPKPDDPPPHTNGAILTPSTIIIPVVSSATEAEMAALYENGKEAAQVRNILNEMGHPQPKTHMQTDNACAAGICNDTVKQKRSKAMDMRYYWIRDRVAQGQFVVHWRRGADNLADYFTKHHAPSHHRLMRSQYLYEPPQSANAMRHSAFFLAARPAAAPLSCDEKLFKFPVTWDLFSSGQDDSLPTESDSLSKGVLICPLGRAYLSFSQPDRSASFIARRESRQASLTKSDPSTRRPAR